MQIDRRIGQLGVTEQQLNGAQIRASLEQVRCEAVPKRVRRNPLGVVSNLLCKRPG